MRTLYRLEMVAGVEERTPQAKQVAGELRKERAITPSTFLIHSHLHSHRS